jgi:hypothetical protein
MDAPGPSQGTAGDGPAVTGMTGFGLSSPEQEAS